MFILSQKYIYSLINVINALDLLYMLHLNRLKLSLELCTCENVRIHNLTLQNRRLEPLICFVLCLSEHELLVAVDT